jgi:hypothetical protein
MEKLHMIYNAIQMVTATVMSIPTAPQVHHAMVIVLGVIHETVVAKYVLWVQVVRGVIQMKAVFVIAQQTIQE